MRQNPVKSNKTVKSDIYTIYVYVYMGMFELGLTVKKLFRVAKNCLTVKDRQPSRSKRPAILHACISSD
jgi:ribosomal protein L30E